MRGEAFLQYLSVMVVSRESTGWAVSQTSLFFFFSWTITFIWKNSWQTLALQTRDLADICFKMNPVSLTLQGKQWTVFVVNKKFHISSKKQDFRKLVYAVVSLTDTPPHTQPYPQYLKPYPMRLVIDNNVLILCNMSTFGTFASSVMLKNYTWVKDPLK